MQNEFLIELQAKLNEAKSKENINDDIDKIQKQLDKLKIQAEIDPQTISNLTKQLEDIINQKIVLSNIGISQNGLKQTGQQVGKIISDSAEKAIDNISLKSVSRYFKINPSDSLHFQAEMENLVNGWTNGKGKITDVNIQTRTSYDKSTGENIERLHQATVTYKNELDEVIKKTIAWKQIGTKINAQGQEEVVRGFVEVAGQYSKSIDTANAKADSFVDKQQKAVATAKNTLSSIESIVSVDRLDYIESELKNIDTIHRGLGKLGKNLTDQFKDVGRNFTQWLSVSSGVMLMVSKTKEAISELKNLDSILTEVSKTSDLTDRQLKYLGKSAFESASKYGKSASDYLTGVQEMYHAGFNNAEQMAELSILAQAAGDMDATTANDYLIASNIAYNLKGNIEDLNKVLDGQNYITNNAAVSMLDMAQATSEAVSIASQYGIKIDELSALIATATSKTCESGNETGNALKSIFVNLQDTTSKPIQDAFAAVNISMTEMVNGSEKLKTPITLLKELSEAFVSLNDGDTKRANILSDIGGKYHANTLSAILSDWATYEKMLNLYSQGIGSAAEEAEKSANNWEGSLNRLSNTWTNIVSNIANSDTIINSINTLNNLLKDINNITDSLSSIGTIGFGAALTGITAFVKNFA